MIPLKKVELKVPPLALVGIIGLAMWVTRASAPGFHIGNPFGRVISAVLILAGGIICLAGIASFRFAKTTVNPTRPETATALVRSGVYRFSRNPMYLGFLFILGGLCFLFSNLLVLVFPVLFVLFMNRFQIVPEERYLASQFGTDFAEYKRVVRRWL